MIGFTIGLKVQNRQTVIQSQEDTMRAFRSLLQAVSPGPGKLLRWLALAVFASAGGVFAALPQITSAVPDFYMYEGQTQQITIKAVDADGDSLSYSLDMSPAGMTLTDSVISRTPAFDQAGVDTVIYFVIEHVAGNIKKDRARSA